jgi:hypothetical protein
MKFIIHFVFIWTFASVSFAQPTAKEMPKGYEQEKIGIPKGKIDTVQYDSKTVEICAKHWFTHRLVSTKRKNIPCFICCMVLVAMKKNGSKVQALKIFWTISMPRVKYNP